MLSTQVSISLLTVVQVDRLHGILKERFHYETQDFQIPSINSDTSLLRTVSSFIDTYNSPDNLMIVYYGGHGYNGTETKQFKLAASVHRLLLERDHVLIRVPVARKRGMGKETLMHFSTMLLAVYGYHRRIYCS